MLTGFNLILSKYGDLAIDVMGSYFRLQSLVFMPVFGLSTGTMPIIGFNFGAKNKERLLAAIKFSTLVAVCFMTFCMLIFQIFPTALLGLYNANARMLELGVPAFRTISLMFPFLGVSVILSTAFQGLGKAHYSLYISMIRQLVILLPAAYILGEIGGLRTIWFAFLIAEIFGVTMVLFLFRKTYTKSVKDWPLNVDEEKVITNNEIE
jgi:Na+-driven multidrug efflux pump